MFHPAWSANMDTQLSVFKIWCCCHGKIFKHVPKPKENRQWPRFLNFYLRLTSLDGLWLWLVPLIFLKWKQRKKERTKSPVNEWPSLLNFFLAVDTGWTLTLAVSMYDLLISRSSKCVYFFNRPKLLGVDNRLVISKAMTVIIRYKFHGSFHACHGASAK